MTADPPPPSLARRAAPYLLAVALTLGVLVPGLRLDRADLRAPLAYGHDALLILPLVKATIERGSHWRNERLGAPGVQELHDFPVVDHLHFAVIWAIGQAFPDPAVAFNLFHLLTYPLATLTGMFAARRLGLSVPAALAVGLLFTFLPYHYRRGVVHYFLAAYYVVPLSLLVMLWVCRGRLPFYREVGEGEYRFTLRTRDTWAAVLVAVMTASAGAYYAFFACALTAAAAAHGWAATGRWRAFASGWLVVVVTVLAGLANHAPTFAYQYQYGQNSGPHARLSEESEIYALKLVQLYLPVTDHHSRWLDSYRGTYQTDLRPAWNENREASLGLVGSAGLTLLLVIAVVPVRRAWPLGPMATLALFGVLLGTLGGIGAVFNHLVTPQVRAYNRVCVYLAFLSYAAALWPLDRWLAGRPRARWAAMLTVVAFGVRDQTNEGWFLRDDVRDPFAECAAQYRADAAFFAELETRLPEGAMVFTTPYTPYPEHASKFRYGESVYDPVRGYLHTKALRWSFGAMKGREADRWHREVSFEDTPTMLRRVTLRGFDGLFLDRLEYPTHADSEAALEAVRAELGPGAWELAHPDGRQFAFDLRAYRDRLRAELGAGYEAAARAEAEGVAVLWLNGFFDFEWDRGLDRHVWCQSRGQAVFVNPTDRPRRLRLTMAFGTDYEESADLRIEGAVWADRFPVSKVVLAKSYEVVVPPGRHTVRFRCDPPASYRPKESRRLVFFVALFKMTEVP